MNATAAVAARPKSKRRWLQFSLRTLFLLTTVVAVWLGILVNSAVKRKRAIESIERLGETVMVEHPAKVRFRGQTAASEPHRLRWLRKLVGDEYFVRVWRKR